MKLLFIDIETAPNQSYTWGTWDQRVAPNQLIAPARTFGFGYRWYGAPGKAKAIWEWDTTHEEMVADAHALLDEADVVCHYNGKRFDIPWLQREMWEHGLGKPSPYHQIDLYQVVRSNFKLEFNKLNYVSKIAQIGQKVDTGGFELWRDVLAGKAGARRKMSTYCLTPDHKFLGEDLRWREVGDFKEGDAILGFEEYAPKGYGRQYRRAVIKSTRRQVAPLMKITLASGKVFRTTPDHKWLVTCARKNTSQAANFKWVESRNLKIGQLAPRLFEMWEEDTSKEAGWLAGMLDGEGHLSVRHNEGQRSAGGFTVGCAQVVGPVADRLVAAMERFSTTRPNVYDEVPKEGGLAKQVLTKTLLKGSMHEKLSFLGRVRPERLIPKLDFNALGRVESRNFLDEIVSIEEIPDGEVVIVETDTATYIADGYPMHNCRQDVDLLVPLYESLLPWITSHPNRRLYDNPEGCTRCDSTELTAQGTRTTSTGVYARYKCANGHWSQATRRVEGTTIKNV